MMKLKRDKKAEVKTEKEKVEERREEILANGRKFKYPLQYAKHKTVFYTIIIATVAMVALFSLGWAMLYKIQNTGDVIYRITKVLPVVVAKVDGEDVRFSDYLMIYRSSLKAVEQQSGQLGEGEDADYVRMGYKRSSLDSAEEYTFALKLGRELGIEVTDDEVREAFDEHRKVGGVERSEESFLKIISDNFGLSKEEYNRLIYLSLMKEKVEEKIDDEANRIAGEVERLLAENGGDYAGVKGTLGEEISYEDTGGLVDNKNIDGGRATKAAKMEAGEQSGRFVSSNGDGYYFVKLVAKTDTQVTYVSIKVPFLEFEKRMSEKREAGAIQEYIELE